jgi:4-amino-4-deoxy-L-arabinose transferase-like glycosyltransferase
MPAASVHIASGLANGPTELGRLPEDTPVDRAIAIFIFALTLAYLWVFRRYTTIEPDEGIILQGAQRILHGEILYQDFFSFFTPGSYYLLAFLFKVFGSSILVARTALVLFGAIYSVVTYLLARRVCSRASAAFVAGVVTLTTLPYRFLVLHNWDSTLWACLSVYCALRLRECSGRKWAFAAGSFASLTFLFEQSKGAGLILGLGIGFIVIRFLEKDAHLARYHVGAVGLGMAWPLAGTFAYFGAQRSLSTMLADWAWPLAHYSVANRVPYGYQGWSDATRHALFGSGFWLARFFYALTLSPVFWIPVVPLAALALFIYWSVRLRKGTAPPLKSAYYVLVCAALSGLLLSIVLVRADIIHFVYLQPLFFLVLAWIVDGRDIPGGWFGRVRPVLIACVAIGCAALSVPLLMRAARAPYKITTPRGTVETSTRETVLEYARYKVNSGETILVYPYLPLYYFLTETFSPSPYDYFQPGMNTPQQAEQVLGELKSKQVRVVLLESSFVEKIPTSWPGTPLSAIGQDPVGNYIQREYRTCHILQSPERWRFLFMVRKDLSCP